MKKVIALGVFALSLLMVGCGDKVVTTEQVPEPVKEFIQQYFPGVNISFAKKDAELTGSHYEVTLADGTEIDFDSDNVWDKVDCHMNPVPEALVPAPIATVLQTNFPDAVVVKIDKERYGYEIELNNDIELKFNEQGALMEMDD